MRKEIVWKEMLAASNEEAKERCMGAYGGKKVKRCIYQTNNKVNEQFGRKMSQDMNGNRKLFWKVHNVKGRKVDSCSRIKEVNESLAQREDEVQRIWKICTI